MKRYIDFYDNDVKDFYTKRFDIPNDVFIAETIEHYYPELCCLTQYDISTMETLITVLDENNNFIIKKTFNNLDSKRPEDIINFLCGAINSALYPMIEEKKEIKRIAVKKCECCGAPLRGLKCEYCGIEYLEG